MFRLLILIISWAFQGLLYLDNTERMFKILLDSLLTLAFAAVFIQFMMSVETTILAFIMAHSVNWILNTNVHMLRKVWKGVRVCKERHVAYLKALQHSLKRERWVEAAAVFGSFETDQFNQASDLDISIFRKQGWLNGFTACLFALRQRTVTLCKGFPLDLYVLDSPWHYTIKPNEYPIILYDPNRLLATRFRKVRYFTEDYSKVR